MVRVDTVLSFHLLLVSSILLLLDWILSMFMAWSQMYSKCPKDSNTLFHNILV